jgi:hypothetical protein
MGLIVLCDPGVAAQSGNPGLWDATALRLEKPAHVQRQARTHVGMFGSHKFVFTDSLDGCKFLNRNDDPRATELWY